MKKPYEIDLDVIKRFNEANTAFHHKVDAVDGKVPEVKEDTHITKAAAEGARTVDFQLRSGFLGLRDEPTDLPEPNLNKNNRGENSEAIKKIALSLGAGSIGITELNPLWLYAVKKNKEELKLPDGVDKAIVMTVPMNKADIQASPEKANMATRVGYRNMGMIAGSIKHTLHQLGYQAVACGNDTALSIPLAIDAGLGEMGRHGQLITPEFGPFVRLCKVFTDAPLEPDESADLGVQEFCRKCGKCARECPVQALSSADEPTYDTACECNNPGVLRWPVHAIKCRGYWKTLGTSCSRCMAVCPFGTGKVIDQGMRGRE